VRINLAVVSYTKIHGQQKIKICIFFLFLTAFISKNLSPWYVCVKDPHLLGYDTMWIG